MSGNVEHRTPVSSRALAWRCPRCTRLTIRMDHEPPPTLCDGGCGPDVAALEPLPLQRPECRW